MIHQTALDVQVLSYVASRKYRGADYAAFRVYDATAADFRIRADNCLGPNIYLGPEVDRGYDGCGGGDLGTWASPNAFADFFTHHDEPFALSGKDCMEGM